MDKTIIKILEKEIEEIETSNPKALEAMDWDLDESDNTIFDCGFIQGLKQAMRILTEDN
tara:strand:+ start:346 stop:522 length:177 start_codon:yes stop_codon:yes gene_type:complete